MTQPAAGNVPITGAALVVFFRATLELCLIPAASARSFQTPCSPIGATSWLGAGAVGSAPTQFTPSNSTASLQTSTALPAPLPGFSDATAAPPPCHSPSAHRPSTRGSANLSRGEMSSSIEGPRGCARGGSSIGTIAVPAACDIW